MTDAAVPAPRASRTGGLLLAAAIVAFGMLGSRLLGVLRTIVIARAFGSSPELGAYFVAFRVPDLIFTVLAGATLGSAFIPVFARLYRRDSPDAAWELASNVLNLVTAATAALCLIAFVLAPWLVPLTAPGLGEDIGRQRELTDQAVWLTRFMLLSPLLFSVSGMITGILNARQRFLLPAIAPMLYNLSIIFGAIVLAGPFGVKGLAIGVVAGAGLHLACQIPGLVRDRMRYRFIFRWRDSAVREVGKLMGPRVIGLAAAQFNFVVTIYFASKIDSSAISDLSYAWLLATLPLALFGGAFSMAVFPRLAEHAADKDFDALRDTVGRMLRVILFLSVPSAIGLVMLRVPITTLLLQRGEFTALDTQVTAEALAWYCLGIVPMAGIEIHSRGFYALGDTRTPVMLAVAAVVVNAVLSAALWSRFEHEGLAFSVSLSAWLEWALLWWLYQRRLGASVEADIAELAKMAFCGAAMALFLALAFLPFETEGVRNNVIIAVAGIGAGAAFYAGMANLLQVEELGEAVERAVRIVRR